MMLNEHDSIDDNYLNKLKNILICQLNVVGIYANIEETNIPQKLSKAQKNLLTICRLFYQDIKATKNASSSSSTESTEDAFIQKTEWFNSQLEDLKVGIYKYDFKQIVGASLGCLFLGIPFFFKFYNDFFFPKIQEAIYGISEAISLNSPESWASKTRNEITNSSLRNSNYISKIMQNITRPKQATHQDLIKAGQILNYPLSEQGICRGYTMRWIEAVLLKQEQQFLDRTNNIMALKQLIIDEKKKLKELENQAEWKDVLLDIKAFYESLYLYQNPMSIIFTEDLNQSDIEAISEFASSKKIEEIGGIKRSHILRYDEFSVKGLISTLGELEIKIKESEYQEPICFLLNCELIKGSHAINVSYDPSNDSWRMMDINLPIHKPVKLDELKSQLLFTETAYFKQFDTFSIAAVLLKEKSDKLEKALSEITKFELTNLEKNQSFLQLASGEGDVEMTNALLAVDGIDPNQATAYGATPLYIAAQNGHLEIVKALLAIDRIDPNQATAYGATPLYIAAQNGHLEIVKALLAIDRIDPNQKMSDSATPLYIAALRGHLDVVKALLAKNGIDPNQATAYGATPLFIAAQNGHLEIVAALLAIDGIDPNQAMSYDAAPLYIAAQNGHLEIVKALLDKNGIDPNQAMNDGKTPLFVAAQNGHLEIVAALLAIDGIAPNQAMSDGKTPLHIAAQNGHLEIVKALLTKDGIAPNQAMSDGKTPLHIAAQNSHLEIVKALLAIDRIDPNQEMNDSRTPLFIAANKGHLKVVEALLVHERIKPNKVVRNNFSPLIVAALRGHLEVVKALLAIDGIAPNQAMSDGKTPLFVAAQNGHLEIVAALLAIDGIAPNQAMSDGKTPLFVAAQNGHLEIVAALLAIDGIAPNQAMSDGATPLFVAAQNGHLEIVKALLDKNGIDPNKAMSDGKTPLHIAEQNDHLEIVYALQEVGQKFEPKF